jgi:hypothetical protein
VRTPRHAFAVLAGALLAAGVTQVATNPGVGAPGSTVAQTPTGASSPDISDDNTAWRHYTGVYVVPPVRTTTRFSFESVSATGGAPNIGNFIDGVAFGTPLCSPATAAAKQD